MSKSDTRKHVLTHLNNLKIKNMAFIPYNEKKVQKRLAVPKKLTQELPLSGLNKSAKIILKNNKEKGFHEEEQSVGALLMLVVSELGEAVEAHREGRFANVDSFKDSIAASRIINGNTRNGKSGITNPSVAYATYFDMYMKDTFEDEIADAVIRLLDLSALLNIDLEKHINEKVRYNKTRPPKHGKQY